MDHASKIAVDLSTKRKEAKEKAKGKRSIGNRTIVNSTIVQGSMAVKGITQQLQEHQDRHKSIGQQKLAQRERRIRLLENADIDEHLLDWVNEGLVHENFMPWVAKCCHVLGLQKVNRIAIQARNGDKPNCLFSIKLKGAMNLAAKRQFFSDDAQPSQ